MVSVAEKFDDTAQVVAWKAAEISEEVADATKTRIVALLRKHAGDRQLRTVRFLPSTKVNLSRKGSFEVLASTTVEVDDPDHDFPFAKSEVLQSVVRIKNVGDKQKLEGVHLVGF